MKKSEISILNVLFCLMVIFIHVTAAPITNLPPDTIPVKVLFTFHRMCGVAVHGFVFLSGMKLFLKDTSKIKYSEYVLARFRKIYVPYLVVTLIYYLYEILRGYYIFDSKQLLTFVVTGSGECHLYFVILIMQFYLLLPLWKKAVNYIHPSILLTACAVINIMGICGLPYVLKILNVNDSFSYNHTFFTSYLFIWILGCLSGKYYEKFILFAKRNVLIFGITSLLLLVPDVYMSYMINYCSTYYNTFVFNTLRILWLAVTVVFLSGVFAGCDFKIFRTKLFDFINNASFEIYLIHLFVLYAVSDFLKKHFFLGQLEIYFVNLVLVYTLSITLCVMYKYFIRRIKK